YDVAAALDGEVAPLDVPPVEAATDAALPIRLEAGADAPRYCGRAIQGVDAAAPTPGWLAERPRRSGVRPARRPAATTPAAMLALGQPMHAFDLGRLSGPIGVRRARQGESLVLLDGREAALDPGFLVVTDADRPVALAGVM